MFLNDLEEASIVDVAVLLQFLGFVGDGVQFLFYLLEPSLRNGALRCPFFWGQISELLASLVRPFFQALECGCLECSNFL